jgi:MFS family permease
MSIFRRVPPGVWALGFVSLFMDVSSEMIHGLLPLFLVTSLHASPLLVGIIDGAAEATVYVTKLFSGVWSDWIGRRKPLLLAGYGLAAFSKPLFPLADNAMTVLGARLLDRFGKGIRGAPRDALVADYTPPRDRGAAYGLRQSLDTVGAIVGPFLAIVLMKSSGGDFRAVFAWAVVPALVSVTVIIFAVREPAMGRGEGVRRFPIRRSELAKLGSAFWGIVVLGFLLGLARFSEAFLLLRTQLAGLPVAWAPMTLIVMNVTGALSSYPAGKLSDRWPRQRLLLIGMLILAVGQALLAAPGMACAVAGIALWGLHLGLTQGVLAALVADTALPTLRGTAFGVFNLVSGLATLCGSVLAGALWVSIGATATFAAGAALSLLLAAVLVRGPFGGSGDGLEFPR